MKMEATLFQLFMLVGQIVGVSLFMADIAGITAPLMNLVTGLLFSNSVTVVVLSMLLVGVMNKLILNFYLRMRPLMGDPMNEPISALIAMALFTAYAGLVYLRIIITGVFRTLVSSVMALAWQFAGLAVRVWRRRMMGRHVGDDLRNHLLLALAQMDNPQELFERAGMRIRDGVVEFGLRPVDFETLHFIGALAIEIKKRMAVAEPTLANEFVIREKLHKYVEEHLPDLRLADYARVAPWVVVLVMTPTATELDVARLMRPRFWLIEWIWPNPLRERQLQYRENWQLRR